MPVKKSGHNERFRQVALLLTICSPTVFDQETNFSAHVHQASRLRRDFRPTHQTLSPWHASSPPIPGIVISSRTTSKRSVLRTSRACSPVSASTTWKPEEVSDIRSTRRNDEYFRCAVSYSDPIVCSRLSTFCGLTLASTITPTHPINISSQL
jgi:hypothetical protein